jgi:hypothetical protein
MSLEARSARDSVRLAGIAQSCAQAKRSEEFLHRAAASVENADLVWAIHAKESLGSYDSAKANEQIANSLAAAQKQAATGSHPGAWWYNIGLLQAALHQKEQAKQSFQQVLILPETQMSHHFAREALAELSAGK